MVCLSTATPQAPSTAAGGSAWATGEEAGFLNSKDAESEKEDNKKQKSSEDKDDDSNGSDDILGMFGD